MTNLIGYSLHYDRDIPTFLKQKCCKKFSTKSLTAQECLHIDMKMGIVANEGEKAGCSRCLGVFSEGSIRRVHSGPWRNEGSRNGWWCDIKQVMGKKNRIAINEVLKGIWIVFWKLLGTFEQTVLRARFGDVNSPTIFESKITGNLFCPKP